MKGTHLTFRRWAVGIALLLAALGATAGVSLMLGSASWAEVTEQIIRVRMTRIVTAAIVGIALGAAGVVFQAVLRNPLADPFILGVSGGGALGAAIGFLIGAGLWTAWPVSPIPLFAFAGSLGAVALVYSLSLAGRSLSTYVLLLVGVVCNALFSALIMLVVSLAPVRRVYEITFWLMGSISETAVQPGELLAAAIAVLAGSAALMLLTRRLNLICLGDDTAERLGVNVVATKRLCFIFASLITGAAVSISGLIGFVGLIVPHAMRLILGPDHRLLLPASAIGGAIFLILADTVVRVSFPIGQTQLPVGVITALVGGPLFILLLHRRPGRAFTQ